MGHSAKEDEDVPDGVKVGLAVVRKEVGAGGIEDALGNQERHRDGLQTVHNGLEDEHNTPPHQQIQGQRETRPLAYGIYLIEGAAQHNCPKEAEDGPTQPAAYHAQTDGSIAAGYHYVDADMV